MPHEIGDSVYLNEEGQDLTKYWTSPRTPEKAPQLKRRGWAKERMEVRQIAKCPSGKAYYRLHYLKQEKLTGSLKTAGVVLAGEEHIKP